MPINEASRPRVAVVMGSISDLEQLKGCLDLLEELKIDYIKEVVSAHRMPDEMFLFAEEAAGKGIKVIIAAAGGAAHLPGMIAAKTYLPVVGVPIKSSALSGLDSLLSIVQMPAGVPVATMAIGPAGAKNAALFAARVLSTEDQTILNALKTYSSEQHQKAKESSVVLNETV